MNRKHRPLALAASILLCVVAGVVVSRSGGGDGSSRPRDAGATAPEKRSDVPSFVASANSDIYVLDLETRSLEQVTRSGREEMAIGPAWSSKDQIAYSTEASGDALPRLFVIRPDGSGRRPVRTGARYLNGPAWAPDGDRLAVQMLGSGIYVLDVRTRSFRRLRATTELDDGPAWSPRGKTIVFQRQVTATNLELYLIDVAGRRASRLTNDAQQQISPVWSPDGSRLAFAEQQESGKWAIATMNLDGSDRKVLTDEGISGQDPAWSPDGKKIAFVLQEGGRDSIALIDADGGDHERISPRSLAIAINPAWSPDGQQIAFAARRAVRPPPAPPPGS